MNKANEIVDDSVISVALVEDDHGLRESLSVLIQGTPGYRCVATYRTAEAALAGLPQLDTVDVVLMDINLPQMSGVQCVQRLKETCPKVRIIMLTIFADSEHIFQALKAGASGYLAKRTPPVEVLHAIKEVHLGGAPMSSEIAAQVVAYFHQKSPQAPGETNLSPRELEILDLLAKGFLYKEISIKLGIAYDTVHWHIRNIYQKLHVRSRSEAIAKYLKE